MKNKKSNGSKKVKRTKKTPVVVVLPTNPIEMENYVENNRRVINEVLLESFDYAIRNSFSGIEVFSFKDSNYVVVINRKDFKDNLQNIFDYSLKNEHFEICAKAKKVIELMDKFSFSMGLNKTKPK